MSLFEYVMVLISVVLSMGIAKLLESHANLVKMGNRVRWSPTYLLWLFIIFICHVDLWASLWVMREATVWKLPALVATLLAAMTLFYSAVLSSPEASPQGRTSLWDFHMENRRRYVGALAGYMVMGTVLNTFVLAKTFSAANLTATLPGLALFVAAMTIRSRWVQIVAPILAATLFGFYFAQYFGSFSG